MNVAALEAELVTKSPDAIAVTDADGIIVSWNAGAITTFRYATEEAVATSLDLIVGERFHVRHWAGYVATMRTGVTSCADRVLAVPASHRDGRPLSIEFRASLLGDDDGRSVAIGAVIRDAAER